VASPKAPVLDVEGKRTRDLSLDEAVFTADVKPHLVHEAVRAELNARRSATKSVKSRGFVAGGRGKPWRQKGTGRARAGTIRAPQFAGGGVAFAPRSNFEVKVNRKAAKAALRSALASHARGGTLAIVDGGAFTEPSTAQAVAFLAEWGAQLPVMVVVTQEEQFVTKSFRNINGVECVAPSELEVAAVVWARSLLITEAALETVLRRAS
jgi:large subunit ribosomal protein L4